MAEQVILKIKHDTNHPVVCVSAVFDNLPLYKIQQLESALCLLYDKAKSVHRETVAKAQGTKESNDILFNHNAGNEINRMTG